MACITGFTIGGYYNLVNCCGIQEEGISPGLVEVCIDMDFSASTVGVIFDSGSTCTQNCNQGPLSYTFQVTGICDNPSGSVLITPIGGTPTYTIDPVTPIGSGLSAQTGNGPFLYSGLTGGTYVFRLNDSEAPSNQELYLNVAISDCFYGNIYDVNNTTCGLNNGSLTISATSLSSPYSLVLYGDGQFNQTQTTSSFPYTFNGLSGGTYYVEVFDYGLSSAVTENVVVNNSNSVDFGFWKVNTSNCVINTGKISVTGTTGTGPFTYLWNNGETTQLITGLTQGTYSCTVTDSLGCQTTKGITVEAALPLGVGLVTTVNPSCFSSDGSLTYTITGGTRPLYYSATTGQVGFTFGDTFTINNLSSGLYTTNIRDANFCELNVNGFVTPPNGFNVVSANVINANCSQNNGQISVQINGNGGFYTYALSGQSTGDVYSNISQNQSYSFNNLANDVYLLIISGSGTNCFYTDILTVNSQQKFSVSASTTGSTCGSPNGIITIDVSSGYTGVLDYVLSNGQSIIGTSLSSYTFTNLAVGSYTYSVTDTDGCEITDSFIITTTGNLITSVNTTNCTNGSNGQAEVIIYEGEPTFTYNWSNNVPGIQTGSTVTGLTAGTYSVLVTDSNGCQSNQNFNIICTGVLISNYQLVNLCNNTFTTTTGTKRGFSEMLNEGYLDITSGYTGCTFVNAQFVATLDINGSGYTQNFYTGTTLNDAPQDILWQTTVENILSTIPDVGGYNIDLINNTLEIKSNCDGDYDPLADASFSLGLEIIYDVYCIDPTP